MAQLGINVDPVGASTPPALALMGSRWVRVVAHPDHDIGGWLHEVKRAGLKVLLVIARESSEGLLWPAGILMWKIQYGQYVDAWQFMNEPDAGWDPTTQMSGHERAASGLYPSSWCMDPDEVSRRLREGRETLGPSAFIVSPGFSSGHPEYADLVELGGVNAVAIHPYAKFPETTELEGMIAAYKQRSDSLRQQLWVTEYDSRTVGMHQSMASDQRIVVATTFCHDDRTMVEDFGMIDKNGQLKPSYTQFIQASGGPVPKPEMGAPKYDVGPGILERMTADKTEPATSGEFWPTAPRQAQFERAYAKDGTCYVYLFETGVVHTYPSTDASAGGTAWRPHEISSDSPNHGGPRARTLGCVIHSTRGGAASSEAEFQGTLNWFANPASKVSAHIVIAKDGTLAYVVDDHNEAWHARSFNSTHLGVELVQQKYGGQITQAQIKTLGWWLKAMSARYGFALTKENLPFHSETAPGRHDGKTDPYRIDDPDGVAFRQALAQYL